MYRETVKQPGHFILKSYGAHCEDFISVKKKITQIIGEDFGSSNSSSLQGNFPEGLVAMT